MTVHNICLDLIKIIDTSTKVEEVGNIVFDTILYGLIFSNSSIEVKFFIKVIRKIMLALIQQSKKFLSTLEVLMG